MRTPLATRRLDIQKTGWGTLEATSDAEAATIARLKANGATIDALPSLRRFTGLRYLEVAGCGLRSSPPVARSP